jgi:PilZ domain
VPSAGTAVVLYIDGFGRFEGNVVRRDGHGFGISFVCTPSKRERTAEQLILFLNKTLVDESLLRRHERSSQKGFAKFTRADGQIVHCEVMDISVGGVSLKSDIKPPIGEFVLIAQIAGRVARHHPDGIGIEFVGQEKTAGEAAHHLNTVR